MFTQETADLIRQIKPNGRWLPTAFAKILEEMRKRHERFAKRVDAQAVGDFYLLYCFASNFLEAHPNRVRGHALATKAFEAIASLEHASGFETLDAEGAYTVHSAIKGCYRSAILLMPPHSV